MIAPFTCTVERIVDADTWVCTDRTRIRAAAINARERDGSCRRGMVCPIMPPARATRIVSRMLVGQRLTCANKGRSWDRVVGACRFADGRSVACAIVATGAAAWEPGWARRYGIGGCRGRS